MFRKFESLIDVFRAHDETQPPAALVGYYWRYCRQTWPFLAALMVSGLFTSLIEVSILRFVGEIVDLLRQTTPERLLEDDGRLFLFMGLVILVLRPLAQLAHDLLVQQTIAPGMTNLIRWQTHRYVLRQSLTYFANDFAGRIASNIVQSAASLRNSTVQVIDALWFVTIFSASALAILAQADWRLTLPLAGWIVVYVATLAALRPAHPETLRDSGAPARGAHRAHRRQLHQHPGGEALRPSRARGRSGARSAEGAHRRLSASDAAHHADEPMRLLEQRRARRRHRRRLDLALDAGLDDRSARSPSPPGSPSASPPCRAG